MPTCKQMTEMATEWLEGGLTEPVRRGFGEHLQGCDGCRAYVRQLEVTRQAVGRLPEPSPSPALNDRVMAQFDEWAAINKGAVQTQHATFAPRFSLLPLFGSLGTVVLLVAFARQRSSAPHDWIVAVGLAVAALAVAALAGRLALAAVAVAVAAAVVAALFGGRMGALDAGGGVECVAIELAASAAVAAVGWIGARRATRRYVRYTVGAAAIAGALAADAALQITCRSHSALPHLFAFHLGGVVLVAGLAFAVFVAAQRPAVSH